MFFWFRSFIFIPEADAPVVTGKSRNDPIRLARMVKKVGS